MKIESVASTLPNSKLRKRWLDYVKHRYIYALVLPGFFYFLLFKVAPMWGLLLAFQEYSPVLGMWKSNWVGVLNFVDLFTYDHFYIMLRNTLIINLLALIFFFPLPIILSLMLNEVRHEVFKRFNQSIVYMPHFLSWVVIVSLTFIMLSQDIGMVNKAIRNLGFEPIAFLANKDMFWGLITAQNIWKDAGWGTILFLAAIAGVDPQRYEAAVVDGAGRFRQIWHITLPAIRPVIIILLILRLGHFVDVSFEQILLMMNPLVLSVADVFDTYTYNQGILRGQLSIGVTVGLFKGLIGLVLVVLSNIIIKRAGHEGIF